MPEHDSPNSEGMAKIMDARPVVGAAISSAQLITQAFKDAMNTA